MAKTRAQIGAAQEVKRLRLLRALERSSPAWKGTNHPELRGGAAAWIRKLRRQDEARYRTRSIL